MKTTRCGNGTVYSIPITDIEYAGPFTATNKSETVKQAMPRLTKLRGRVPDFLMNAELFDFSTRKPVSDVVVGGVVHKLSENYGISFVNNKTPTFSYKNNAGAKDYLGAYPVLIKGGKIESSIPSGLSGSRGRVALGVGKGNFFIGLVPEGSGDVTLATLRNCLWAAGCTDAINLDGGGSTQFYAPDGNAFADRKVRGFFALWLKQSTAPKTETVTTKKETVTPKKDIRTVNIKNKPNNFLKIRSKPSTVFGKVIGKLYRGNKIEVVKTEKGWCQIVSGGWVSAQYLVK